MKILENGESKRLRRRSLQRRSSTVDCGALRREEAPCTRCEDDVAASIIIVILDVLLTIVQIIVFLYDVISYPVYRFLSRALSQVTLLGILPNLTFCNNSTPLCWLLILTCHLVLKHTDFIKRIFSCYVQFIAITFKPTLAFVPDLSLQSAQHNNTGQCHNSHYGLLLQFHCN